MLTIPSQFCCPAERPFLDVCDARPYPAGYKPDFYTAGAQPNGIKGEPDFGAVVVQNRGAPGEISFIKSLAAGRSAELRHLASQAALHSRFLLLHQAVTDLNCARQAKEAVPEAGHLLVMLQVGLHAAIWISGSSTPPTNDFLSLINATDSQEIQAGRMR